MLKLLFIFILTAPLLTLGQSPYFDSLQLKIASIPPSEKIKTIINIPFEKMNTNIAQSIKFYETALVLADSLKNKKFQAELHEKFGLVHYYQGNYEKSVNANLKSIELYEELNLKGRAGNVYATLGHQMKGRDLPKAMEYMRNGISLQRAARDTFRLAGSYNNFGWLHQMNKNLDSALFYYNKGLKITTNLDDSLGMPYSLNSVAGVYLERKQFDLAKSIYDRAFEIRKIRNDKNGMAENYQFYGDLYFAQKNYPKSAENYKKSLDIGIDIKYTNICFQNSAQLALCYEKMNQLDSALFYQKESYRYKDQMINEATNNTIAALEIQFDTEKNEKEIALQKMKISEQDQKARQLNYLLFGLGALLLFALFIGNLLFKQQRLKQEKLKEENRLKDEIAKEQLKNKLHEERLRISRDLHDNIGSQLTFITSSMDNLKFITKEEKVNAKLDGLTDFTRETITQLRDTIWAMNKGQITLDDFHGRLFNFILGARNSTLNTTINFEEKIESKNLAFTAEQGINLFRIVQESINNAIKYAMSSNIEIKMIEQDDHIFIRVKDDGIGFEKTEIQYGNGIKNMSFRAQEIDATFEMNSSKNEGTQIKVSIQKNKLIAV